MVDIIIMTDFEEGHIFPTLKMANNFEKNGYKVCYLGIPDAVKHLKKTKLDYRVIFEDIYPEGFVKSVKKNSQTITSLFSNHYPSLIDGALDSLISELNPKLILTNYFLALDGLIMHYKYDIDQIIYHTLLPPVSNENNLSLGVRSANNCIKSFMSLEGTLPNKFLSFFRTQNISITNFNDLAKPITKMPQLMLCPREFKIKDTIQNELDIYLGPGIYNTKSESQNGVLEYLPSQFQKENIIFASLGSQTKEYPQKAEFIFNMLINCMKTEELKKYHLILTIGSNLDKWKLEDIPKNVSVFDWVPQIEILQHVSMAITHGGLGSVKECIHFGVPMLVIPLGRDQMDNAQRVKHHKIGLKVDTTEIKTSELTDKIKSVLTDKTLKQNTLKMSNSFETVTKKNQEISFIKKYIKIDS